MPTTMPDGPAATRPSAIAVGCKLQVLMSGENAWRKAEVLSIRFAERGEAATEFYVHYVDYNKRLDEWVPVGRLDLNSVEYPRPKKSKATASGAAASKLKGASGGVAGSGRTSSSNKGGNKGGSALSRKGKGSSAFAVGARKRKAAELDEGTDSLGGGAVSSPTPSGNRDNLSTPDPLGSPREGTPGLADGSAQYDDGKSQDDSDARPDTPNALDGNDEGDSQQPGFSKVQEREKLRTSGSMTQCVSEISRVKNLNKIQMGRHIAETWYFSPYPLEWAHIPLLYICEFCLAYFGCSEAHQRHRAKCPLTHPPGNEIYRKDNLSFFEIDGRKQKTYCRNLCLLSKCFLDHKTLYYDVDPFLFYIMTITDKHGSHLVGYFSKEKESAEGYNVACILTLPQHQRKGYGRLLIQFSYELSKIERRTGSPEKPLSDLGLLGYRKYWAEVLVEQLLKCNGEITLEELSAATAITVADIQHTLQALEALRYYKGQHVICLTQKCIDVHEASRKKKQISIDPSCLDWKPPLFSAKEKYLN